MCSETSEAVGTTWEHAQLEIQKFLKIRITLVVHPSVDGLLPTTSSGLFWIGTTCSHAQWQWQHLLYQNTVKIWTGFHPSQDVCHFCIKGRTNVLN